MLSGRLCRACRLRLLGSQSNTQQAQHCEKLRNFNQSHARNIGTTATTATGAERVPVVSHRSRFSQSAAPDWPLSSPARLPSHPGGLGEQTGQESNSETRRRLRRAPQEAGSQQPIKSHRRSQNLQTKESKDVQREPFSKIRTKRHEVVHAGARRNITPGDSDEALPALPGDIYRTIRRRWGIPAEKSASGFYKHHQRTAAFIPVLSQQHKQWGYLRHQLSASELPDAKRALNSWYQRLGLVLVEPHRLKGRATWLNEASWLLEYSSAPAMCSAWTKLDMKERQRLWPAVMLSTMLKNPSRAFDVLAATMSPLPPGYAITDVLQFVAQNFARHWPSGHRDRAARADEIVHFMEEILVHMPKGHMRPTQMTFGILAKMLPPSHARELYHMMKQANIGIHENTALQFASTLSQGMEHKREALSIVLEAAKRGTDLNSAKVTSVVTSLLHCPRQKSKDDLTDDTASSFSKKALEELMEQGFTPNVISLTAFLDALCWDGELDEAIRLALLFSESGAKLDGRTFNTIFRAAKESQDPEKMRQALDVAKAARAPIVDVLNNALHSVFYVSETQRRDAVNTDDQKYHVFEEMLRLYSQRFSLESLQALLPVTLPLLLANQRAEEPRPAEQQTALSVAQDFFQDTQLPTLQPNITTLSIMLRAYIRSLHHPYDIVSFYEFFKYKLEMDEEEEVNLARSLVKKHRSLIHDTVILAMLDHKLSTRQLLQVLGDMLRDNLPTNEAQDSDVVTKDELPKPVHPAPTLFTLSILISRLLLRQETMVAKQLMAVMREHGIEPNLETWNAMVKGYAVLQDVPRTVSMLQKLEAAGHTPDHRTYKAFGQLKNQTHALKLMDKIIRQNEAKLAHDDLI